MLTELPDDDDERSGQVLRWLALPAVLVAYPLFVLPRALWSAWRARRRLRLYGRPALLVPVDRRLRG